MTAAPPAAPVTASPARGGVLGFVIRYPWVVGVVLGVVALTAMRGCQSRRLAGLPVLGTVPDFALTTQTGAAITAADLDKKVWIASFFFTSCKTTCPAIMQAMNEVAAGVQAGLPQTSRIQLVSFSVDPEFDTPTELTRYAAERKLDLSRWRLVTGARKDIEALVMDGFKTAVGDKVEKAGIIDISHSMKLVLIDGERHIRHYFSASDAKDRETIVAYAIDMAKTMDAAAAEHPESRP